MEYILWLIITSTVFIVQTQITILDNPLNITTALVFAYGIRNITKNPHVKGYWSGKGEIKSVLFGGIIGAIEDGLSNSIIGPSILSKALIGFASTYVFSDIFFKWTYITGASVLALLTIFDNIVIVSLRLLMTEISINSLILYEMVLIQVAVNFVIAFFINFRREDML